MTRSNHSNTQLDLSPKLGETFIPEFGCDKDVLSLHNSIGETLLQCHTHLSLVAIDVSTVHVNVALLQSGLYSCSNLTWLGEPRPESVICVQ